MINSPSLSQQESQQEITSGSKNTQTDIQTLHEGVLKGPKTIEIAGHTILAMPLESMGLTPEQEKKFIEAGGLMNPTSEVATAPENQNKMMYWVESFENLEAKIDGKLYTGFELFKKVYEAFPEICSMSQKEAEEAGLYPYIHYRNFAARKWMAEMNAGHIATLDEDYNGELRDIYNAAPGQTNLQKLAAMGQAPLGGRDPYYAKVVVFGNWVSLASGSLNGDGDVLALGSNRDMTFTEEVLYWQSAGDSSVVIINK